MGERFRTAFCWGSILTSCISFFATHLSWLRRPPTFARLPILSKHVPISAEDHPHELVVGTIGTDVEFNDPYLDADTSLLGQRSDRGH